MKSLLMKAGARVRAIRVRPTRARCAILAAGLVLATFAGGARAEFSAALQTILTKDQSGAGDSALTGRYQDSVLLAQTIKAFDEIALPAGPARGKPYASDKAFESVLTAQGKVMRSIYLSPTGRPSLEVATNYFEKVAASGFTPVFQCAGEACGESFVVLKYRWDNPKSKVLGENFEQLRKLMVEAAFDQMIDVRYALFKKSAPEGDSYVAIYAGLHRGGGFGTYSQGWSDRVGVLVEVVEPRAMDRRMVVVSAEDIGNKVAAEGRAVFYGIQFDFDKADIKPESAPQLEQMAKFLADHPQMRVFIIGHSDNRGQLDYNLGLSSRRAVAVARALAAQFGLDPARLAPRGLGPLAPIATNRSDEGRAKNRRVEMVEQ